MQTQKQHNEEGFAFVLEIIVVAMVLSAVGFGFFQYSQHSKSSASKNAPVSAEKVAADVNESIVKSANVEVQESVDADALGDELQAADAASADSEGGIDESSF